MTIPFNAQNNYAEKGLPDYYNFDNQWRVKSGHLMKQMQRRNFS
jgi:hypothetical protein